MVARRPYTERPTRPSDHRGAGRLFPGSGLLRLPANLSRQSRDLTQTSNAILKIRPEIDSQSPARLLQARKRVSRLTSQRAPSAPADLPLLHVVADVPLAQVVVQRHLWPLQHQ